jgi:hypothetical protein
VTTDTDHGPVGFTIDHDLRAHFVYSTGNFQTRTLRYVNNGLGGAWRNSLLLQEFGNDDFGFMGVDLVRKGGPLNEKLLASWSAGFVGLLGFGCGNCEVP